MKTILVTGGAGFIGAKTVLRLMEDRSKDFVIHVLDLAPLKETIYRHMTSSSFFLYSQGDATSFTDFTKAAAGADIIIHLARSADPEISMDLLDYNCTMTDHISRYAGSAKLEKIVLASSFQVYGKSAVPGISETAVCQPVSSYARSKFLSEKMLGRLSQETGMPTVVLRYFNIYGPGATTGILKVLADKLSLHSSTGWVDLSLRNDGGDGRDYVHIDDAVSAIAQAIDYPCILESSKEERFPANDFEKNIVVNIGTGRCTAVKDLLSLFESASGAHLRVSFGSGQDPIRSISADCSRMIGLLGMKPALQLENGIKSMIST